MSILRNCLINVLLILCFFITSGVAQADTIHQNVVNFHGFGNGNISFALTQFMITNGQPYSNQIDASGTGELIINAGRHDSSQVVNELNSVGLPYALTGSNVNSKGVLQADTVAASWDDIPSELNFAIYGTLTVYSNNTEYVCPGVAIGQGSRSLGGNNWWFFSNQAVGGYVKSNQYICLKCNNGNIELQNSTSDNLFINIPDAPDCNN